ncbi:endospore germination permease [Paenibacillus yanchengensis]|uniref:Endospore germination permease n=1 Tax=Paenibacillus yanchengensis TaxID=2035833 RepID=A0ABW4YG00_9BACL
MQQQGGLKLINLAIIFVISISISNYTVLLTATIEVGQRDAWISGLVGFLVAIFFIWPISYIMKKTAGMSLYAWLTKNYNKAIAIMCVSLVAIFLAIQFMITMREALEWAEASFLPATPTIVIGLIFVVLALAAARSGLQTIALCAGIIVPFFIGLSLLLAVENFTNTDYYYLLPIMENGAVPILKGAAYSVAGLSEITLLLLVQQRMNRPAKAASLFWVLLIIAMLFFIVVIQAVASFGPIEAAKQRYTYFELWRLTRFNKYIEHVDFLSVLQSIAASFVRLSFLLYLFGLFTTGFRSHTSNKKGGATLQTVRLVTMVSLCAVVLILLSISSIGNQIYHITQYLTILSPLLLVIFLMITLLLVLFRSNSP